ncbi:TetR/AcrR family transcriptional regulator [Cucumibacter marinus]|uniref:TetR/AcrR family transcriptional regulator n=1 Tax=Cucumibacter marinus TaxID=1121252 RepID=UPI0004100460|nr:TetR/AcrR family transcriptional regulator [Cucumibacter marinus]
MGRPKTYDRDAVIERAMEAFWRFGYEGAHLSALVEATGLNRFSLYKEFEGKAGLFCAALSMFTEALVDEYRLFLDKEPKGLANIEASLRSLEYGSDYYGCFMINTLTQRDTVPQPAFAQAQATAGEIEALYVENIRAAQARGEVSGAVDPEDMGKMLYSLDLGLHIKGLAGGGEAEKDTTITVALNGLKAGSAVKA